MGSMKILAKAAYLWTKLNVRVAILTSLSLQVFLIFLAPIRKRFSSRWILIPIWLAYLLADLVADYAFGLISRAQMAGGTSESEADAYSDLLAFWAPFLLLHLGGPDTITAFALEDNELWHRHLLNLLFQLGVAIYVFYQSFPSSKLMVPTILMFIGGTFKYIERTRALHLASFSKFRSSLLPPADAGPNYAKLVEEYVTTKKSAMVPESNSVHVGEGDTEGLDNRRVIKEAFSYFGTFKGLLVDLIFSFHEREKSSGFFGNRTPEDAFRVIEVELNFFYDVLYTKAAIVHCPAGYAFRAISIGSIVSAFTSFYVLNKHGFPEYDKQITYTLLLGAIGLEFVALGRLICSDWTIANIATFEEHRRSNQNTTREHGRSLFDGSNFIEFLLKFKSKSSPFAWHLLHARWSKSIFLYNFLDSRLRKLPNWIEKLLGLIFLGEFFDDLRFGRVKQFSDGLGNLIFKELKRKASVGRTNEICSLICSSRGKWALEHTNSGEKCKKLLPFVCDVDYGKSLLLWHIATELCYNIDESANPNYKTSKVLSDYMQTSKVLSDYMLHLMIKKPSMMSAVVGIGQIRFQDTCAEADRFFDENILDKSKMSKERACRLLLSVPTELNPAVVKGDRSKSALFDACILAKELEKFRDKKWDIISEVWVELLAYAAIHCQPFMHAQQLSKGGELLTLVWLLMVQLGLSEQYQIEDGHLSAKLY